MKQVDRTAVVVLILSGAAALGHQLLWTRRMTDLLGAGAEASARVLGCFFLGLALGAALAGRLMPRISKPWHWAAMAELAAAVASIPIMFLPALSDGLWPLLGPDRMGTWHVGGLRLLLSVGVVVPPAMAVGMSLPLIIEAVRRGSPATGGRPIALYTAYTFGSATGLAIVVGITLQTLGARGSMAVMMLLNLAAAALCWRQSSAPATGPSAGERKPIPAASRKPATSFPPIPSSRLLLGAAFFSGAGVLATEVLTIELVNLTAPLAFYPQAAVLFSAVFLLAIAAAISGRFLPRLRRPADLVPWVLGVAGVFVAASP